MAEASGTSSGASGPSESQEIELSSDSESAIVSGACTPVESSSTSADSGRVITSLLDRLKSPEPSHLARKRTITGNMPPVGKKRGKGATAGDPKSVSPAERVKAYPNEPLTVSNKKTVLFWLPRTTIPEKELDRASSEVAETRKRKRAIGVETKEAVGYCGVT